MAEYIERKETINALLEKGQRSRRYKLGEIWELNFNEIREAVGSIPPADVQPVRRGKWIKDSDGLDVCSECEEIALQRVFIKLPEKLVDLQMVRSNYCPNCGADMRGDDDV